MNQLVVQACQLGKIGLRRQWYFHEWDILWYCKHIYCFFPELWNIDVLKDWACHGPCFFKKLRGSNITLSLISNQKHQTWVLETLFTLRRFEAEVSKSRLQESEQGFSRVVKIRWAALLFCHHNNFLSGRVLWLSGQGKWSPANGFLLHQASDRGQVRERDRILHL